MMAILRRELRSYLRSRLGWGLMCLYLLGFGVFLAIFNLMAGDPNFSYPVSYVQPVLILVIPLMTMRALAEEREKGTEEMLFALPVSTTGLILGKYLAVVALFAIPTAICGVYPMLLSMLGKVALGSAYTAMLGLLLLGCALISFCLFLSTLCKSRMIAFWVSAGSLLAVYLFNVVADLLGGVPFLSDLFFGINPFSKANALLYGRLDVTAVAYLLVMTVVFLLCTVLTVKARRGFGGLNRGMGGVLGAGALAIAIVLQMGLGFLPYTATRLNVSGDHSLKVTEPTSAWLSTLEENVTLYFLCDGGVSHASQDFYGYLLEYAENAPKV